MMNNNIVIESSHLVNKVQETQAIKAITKDDNTNYLKGYITNRKQYKYNNLVIPEYNHHEKIQKSRIREAKAQSRVLQFWDEKMLEYEEFEQNIDNLIWICGMSISKYEELFKRTNKLFKLLRKNDISMVNLTEYNIYLDNKQDIYTNNNLLTEKLELIKEGLEYIGEEKQPTILINHNIVGITNPRELYEMTWTKTILNFGYKIRYI